MKSALILLLATAGCSEVIETGHRGLLFDPRNGLSHKVLGPGKHWVGAYGHIENFDITFSTHKEELHTVSSENLGIDVRVAIIYRPIVDEIYDLDTEIGLNYYDEVVGPEFRTSTIGVMAHHSYTEVQRKNEKIEDEIEDAVRRRIKGRHVEVSSVVIEGVQYGGEIRAKMQAEQDAARRRFVLEEDNKRKNTELAQEDEREQLKHTTEQRRLQHDSERAEVQAKADLHKKENERAMAEEEAKVEKLNAETAATVAVTKAKADAETAMMMAKVHAAEKKAEATSVTPLMVMMHAYDALSNLGGDGTHIMLGDWSKVPQFLFPPGVAAQLASFRAGGVK